MPSNAIPRILPSFLYLLVASKVPGTYVSSHRLRRQQQLPVNDRQLYHRIQRPYHHFPYWLYRPSLYRHHHRPTSGWIPHIFLVIEDFHSNNKISGGGANIDLVTWIRLHFPLLNVVTIVVVIGAAINNLLLRYPLKTPSCLNTPATTNVVSWCHPKTVVLQKPSVHNFWQHLGSATPTTK